MGELRDALSKRFLARDGVPWDEIEDMEEEAYRLADALAARLAAVETEYHDLAGKFAALTDSYLAVRAERDEARQALRGIAAVTEGSAWSINPGYERIYTLARAALPVAARPETDAR